MSTAETDSQIFRNRLGNMRVTCIAFWFADLAIICLGNSHALASTEHLIPYFLSANDGTNSSVVRVINRSNHSGVVELLGVDDTGRKAGPVQLTLDAGAAVSFDSIDFEQGNFLKGFSAGVGTGQGSWWLKMVSELDIQPRSYVRGVDGLVADMQETARTVLTQGRHVGFHVPTFNPGGNWRQQSALRLVNTADREVEVVMEATDDLGNAAPGGRVSLTLAARESRIVTARALERGANGLDGAFGSGQGRWRLIAMAPPSVLVMSLVRTTVGALTNISGGGSPDALNLDELVAGKKQLLPLFLAHADGAGETFARIINHSDTAGRVTIHAIDDVGGEFGPIHFTLNGMAAKHFNSRDLELGNAAQGLPLGIGDGLGDWRLELFSDLPIEALAYIRNSDGSIANVQSAVLNDGDVSTFNPASDVEQQSLLRLVNTLDHPVEISIEGVDDRGVPSPMEVVRLTLPPGGARYLTAQELESGGAGLRGRLGDGVGKWRLSISAPDGVLAMNLMQNLAGHLINISSGAFAEPQLHNDSDGDGLADYDDAFPMDAARQLPVNGVSTTMDGQIIVRLDANDVVAPNHFDLRRKTVSFARDERADSGYTRTVKPLAWESEIGVEIDSSAIGLQQFSFPFSGKFWDSLYVNQNGTISFLGPIGHPLPDWWSELRTIGGSFTNGLPTLAALYKMRFQGRRYINQLPDRVVVTWELLEPHFGWVDFSLVAAQSRVQAVLFPDGSVDFNYMEVAPDDGIVGLFPIPSQEDLLATVFDEQEPEIPDWLDLTEVRVFDSDLPNTLFVEFTTRGDISEPIEPSINDVSFKLHIDIDAPLMQQIDFSDRDYEWRVFRTPTQSWDVDGYGAMLVDPLAEESSNTIRLQVSIPDFLGGQVAAFAESFVYEKGKHRATWVDYTDLVTFSISSRPPRQADWSEPDPASTGLYEVFHHWSAPDSVKLACRVVRSLGDGFDFFIPYTQFRMDQHGMQGAMTLWGEMAEQGIGFSGNSYPADFCSEGKLRGQLARPITMQSNNGRGYGQQGKTGRFGAALALLGHEIGHLWGAKAAFESAGQRIALTEVPDGCNCHWSLNLHTEAAFPWKTKKQASLMSGGYWEDNQDGTFTLIDRNYIDPASGFSHLDLYLMGLLDASEVPNTFILRDVRKLNENSGLGVFTGTRHDVSIEAIVAALGHRIPSSSNSQKEFNAGFLYLVAPGNSPKSIPLRRHAALKDQFLRYWKHITGGRSQITTNVQFGKDIGFGRPVEHNKRTKALGADLNHPARRRGIYCSP